MCLGFCFPLWTCPYLHGCGFNFAGGGKVLPASPVRLTARMWAPLVCGPCSTVVSLFHWVTQAVTDCQPQQSSITLNAPVPCCCKRRVLQVTLKHSPSAAIVYSCGVHPVPIKKLAMAYKDGALISVWWYSLGSQLMIRPAWLKRSSYVCFCTYLKFLFLNVVSIEVPVLFSTSLTALSLFNSK